MHPAKASCLRVPPPLPADRQNLCATHSIASGSTTTTGSYLMPLAVVEFGGLDLAPDVCSACISLLPQPLLAALTSRQAALCTHVCIVHLGTRHHVHLEAHAEQYSLNRAMSERHAHALLAQPGSLVTAQSYGQATWGKRCGRETKWCWQWAKAQGHLRAAVGW